MKKNLSRPFWYFMFCICCLPISQLGAQGVISSDGGVVTITFDNSTPGILNGSFDATHISSTPSVGDLDADGVCIDDDIPGTADVPAVFGSNDVSFWGVSSGNVSSSAEGIWAFDVNPGAGVNRALGFQPGNNVWGAKDNKDGQIVFKFVNNSGKTLTAFRVKYDIYEANDGDRNSVIEAYLTTNVSSPNYGPVRDSYTTTGKSPDFVYRWSGANSVDFSVTSGVNVPNGGAIYLRFYIYDGLAYSSEFPWRDEFAIDNISIIGASTPDLLDQCLPPIALCKNTTVNLNSSGSGTLAVSSVNNGSTADCGLSSMSLSRTSFTCSNVGSNSVTLTVTDVKGKTGTCTSTVTVVDNVKPTATCQNVTVQLDANGNGSTSASAVHKSSNDACGIVNMSLNKTSFNCSNVGSNTVILTVTDKNNNTGTCSATVTVVDNVNPTASCKSTTVQVQLDDNGQASITPSDINNGSFDACGIASMSLSKTSFTCSDVGNKTVVLTVTDNNKNVSTCSANIIVVDRVQPVAVCKHITVQLDANGMASISPGDVDGGSSDACGIASMSLSKTSFTCTDIGRATVSLVVSDNNNNRSSCLAAINLEDNIKPTASCKSATVQLDANGNGYLSTIDIDNGSSDACGILDLSLDKTSFSCSDIGLSHTVIMTVTDNRLNTSTCSATVTVEDNVKPTASCKSATVQLDASGNGSISTIDIDNGSSDACGIAKMTLDKTSFSCSDIGSNTVILTVTDNHNNTSTCPGTVTVENKVKPTASCQHITVQLDASGNGSIIPGDIDNGSSGGCGILKLDLDKTSFSCSDVGSNTVILTVTDDNNNVSTCSATVTVEDKINPTLAADLIFLSSDECNSGNFRLALSASDNCDGNPSVVSVMGVPQLFGWELDFNVKSNIKMIFNPSQNKITVEAPNPEAFWAEIVLLGGIPLSDGQELELNQNNGPGLKTQNSIFSFDDAGNLLRVIAPDITIVCTATDFSGNTTSVTLGAAYPPCNRKRLLAPASGSTADLSQGRLSDLSLFPNPAIGEINWRFNLSADMEKMDLQLIDITGAVLHQQSVGVQQGQNMGILDISQLTPGIYFLRVTGNETYFMERFVKID